MYVRNVRRALQAVACGILGNLGNLTGGLCLVGIGGILCGGLGNLGGLWHPVPCLCLVGIGGGEIYVNWFLPILWHCLTGGTCIASKTNYIKLYPVRYSKPP